MVSGPTKNIVMSLRAVREERGITIPELHTQTGISESTLRRVFLDDLDGLGGFSYEGMLAPLIDLLLPKGDISDSALSQSRIDGLLAVIEIKNEQIRAMSEQVQELRTTYLQEKIAAEQKQAARCTKCEDNVAFLKDQISLKDARMDAKDAWINQLLEQQTSLLSKLTDKML